MFLTLFRFFFSKEIFIYFINNVLIETSDPKRNKYDEDFDKENKNEPEADRQQKISRAIEQQNHRAAK